MQKLIFFNLMLAALSFIMQTSFVQTQITRCTKLTQTQSVPVLLLFVAHRNQQLHFLSCPLQGTSNRSANQA